jgi:hypothetical protein
MGASACRSQSLSSAVNCFCMECRPSCFTPCFFLASIVLQGKLNAVVSAAHAVKKRLEALAASNEAARVRWWPWGEGRGVGKGTFWSAANLSSNMFGPAPVAEHVSRELLQMQLRLAIAVIICFTIVQLTAHRHAGIHRIPTPCQSHPPDRHPRCNRGTRRPSQGRAPAARMTARARQLPQACIASLRTRCCSGHPLTLHPFVTVPPICSMWTRSAVMWTAVFLIV